MSLSPSFKICFDISHVVFVMPHHSSVPSAGRRQRGAAHSGPVAPSPGPCNVQWDLLSVTAKTQAGGTWLNVGTFSCLAFVTFKDICRQIQPGALIYKSRH